MRKQRVEKAKSLSRQWKMFASPSGLDGKIKIYLVWKKISEKYENMKKFARFARKREDT